MAATTALPTPPPRAGATLGSSTMADGCPCPRSSRSARSASSTVRQSLAVRQLRNARLRARSPPRRAFPLLDLMAQSLDDVSTDFRWSRERLWALDLPVARVSVEDLRFHL